MTNSAPFDEDDLLPLSALQHLVYCERQYALIHVEQLWAESSATVEGRLLHERQDEAGREVRGDLVVAHALPLRSLRLGLAGRADAVEFHRLPSLGGAAGVRLAGLSGRFFAFPVETKRGKPKSHDADRVQLCAQALCLEEMLEISVQSGALFYGTPRRREEVEFDAALRDMTEKAALRIHELFERRETPAAVRAKKCDRCSLIDLCLPDLAGRSALRYLDRALATLQDERG